jgi:DNA-directed RNA polymerase III subunit RPC2
VGSVAPTPHATAASKVATHPAQNSHEHRDKNGDEPAPQKPKKVDPFDALLEPFYYNKSLTDPIDTARDKWNLLPAFLKVKGLVKQHIDSYNYFVEVQLKKILRANSEIRSSENRSFFIK